MNCLYCNTPLPDGAKNCPGCGWPTDRISQTVPMAPTEDRKFTPGGAFLSLYNPNAAASWSVLLTPVFGSWCIYDNYKAMGETRRANISLIVTIVLAVMYAAVPILLPICDLAARIIPLATLFVWYLTEQKSQVRFIRSNGIVYEKKPWSKPAAIGFAGVIVLMVLCVVVQLVF